jgi:hypothetical protein
MDSSAPDEGKEKDDGENEIKSIVAICFSNRVLGIASYIEIENAIMADSINCNEDVEEALSRVKLVCSPTLFVVHPSIVSNKPMLDVMLSGIDGTPGFYR